MLNESEWMEIAIMFPIMVIVIGVAVLVFGKRLAVLGGAVGALLGVGILGLFPGQSTPVLQIAIPLLLAVIGFFAAGLAKGVVNIVLLVLGALAGAAIMLGFLELFSNHSILLGLLLAVVGGVAGSILVMRFKDWAMIILSGLIGGLLVTRGLTIWLPFLQGALGTLLVIVLTGVGIGLQGGLSGGRKTAG
jgi:hypothetical protein